MIWLSKEQINESATLPASNTIHTNGDNLKSTFALFSDLPKAFDTVSHTIILSKIAYFGVRSVANGVLRSYITDRS